MNPRALATEFSVADDIDTWRALGRTEARVLRLVPTPEPDESSPLRDDDHLRVALRAQVHQAKLTLIALSERLTELLAVAEHEERAAWEATMDDQRLSLQHSIDAWMHDRRGQLEEELQAARMTAARRRYAVDQVLDSSRRAEFVRSSFG